CDVSAWRIGASCTRLIGCGWLLRAKQLPADKRGDAQENQQRVDAQDKQRTFHLLMTPNTSLGLRTDNRRAIPVQNGSCNDAPAAIFAPCAHGGAFLEIRRIAWFNHLRKHYVLPRRNRD